jgi:multisubunit Na+/H+ antiporter MnhC subunit
LSPRKFKLICGAAVIAAVALTMFVAGLDQLQAAAASPSQGSGDIVPEGVMIQPLSLSLSLTVVIDMGLMTLGLVILFMDDAPSRYRAR